MEEGGTMDRIRVLFGLVVLLTVLVFSFVNCAEVEFKDVDQSVPVSEFSSEEKEPNQWGRVPTPMEETEVIDGLSPEEVVDPVPVTETNEDSDLEDRYSCRGRNQVMICHFPASLVGKSLCVGKPAVAAHLNHIHSYFEGDEEKEIGDYLGPCRAAE